MECSAEPTGFHYVGNLIRPPSEADSILIQATVGCSHNKCSFCCTYRDKRFAIKDQALLDSDLRFAEKYCRRQDRVFIMDGDALIMPMPRWEWLLGEIQRRLPWVRRVGAYANAKGVSLKSDADLARLKELGLGIVYYGVESGDADVLKAVRKGSSPEKLIAQGKRLKAAGIKLSVTVLVGLGGEEGSLRHAQATGALLSEMDPDFVGALTLMPIPGTPLGDEVQAGRFHPPDKLGMLRELREMIASTHLSGGLFYANHASNYLPIRARLPQDRERTLALIDAAVGGKVGLKPEWLRAL